MSRLVSYLQHIGAAIDRIDKYTAGMKEADFASNTLVQDAVIRNIEIIGEGARNIMKHAPEFAAAHPQLRLDAAYQMRNAVAHGYFKVDLELVWATVKTDLPKLSKDVARIINDEAGSGK